MSLLTMKLKKRGKGSGKRASERETEREKERETYVVSFAIHMFPFQSLQNDETAGRVAESIDAKL